MLTKLGLAASFLGVVLAANFVTTEYGMIPLGFGLTATAGTYLAGMAFILRDAIQDALDGPSDRAARWLWHRGIRWSPGRMADDIRLAALAALILAGAALSYGVSAPVIATASAVAFLLSEVADWAIYSPLRERGYVRAAVASNLVGSVVDTVIFLAVAGFPIRQAFAGQIVGKMLVTGVAVGLVMAARAGRRLVTA